MSNEILSDNDYEALKLFDAESEISKETSEYLKKIVGNLFKDTSINADDFHYMIFDEDEPNAFFMSSEHTKDQKNILAVSRGLIEECQNEAELAGIIGHECGHYLWKEILGGSNTIFQEHTADLRAIDLMMNAGFKDENNEEYKYNPRHHLAVCERIFSRYGRSFSDISIGVHGNSLARIEDIKDYMTKIANEKGDFPPISEEEDNAYKSFQAKIKSIYEKEGYDTYLDKCFKRKYGTKDRTKISIEDVMTTMIEEISSNRITPKHKVRFNQVLNIIDEYSKNGLYNSKSERLTELCKKFFEITKDNIERNGPYDYNEYPERSLPIILKQFKLDIYGDFAKQMDNVNHFVNYTDKEDAIHWAKEMYELRWTISYARCFENEEYDNLKARREDNVGRPLPWTELNNFINDGNLTDDEVIALKWARDVVYRDRYGSGPMYSYSSYNITEEDKKREKCEYQADFYYLEDDIVVAFGHDAIARHAQDKYKRETEDFLRECGRAYKQFDRNITIYSELATFVDENATQEAISESKQKLKKYFSEHGIEYCLNDDKLIWFSEYDAGSNPANVRNPYVEEIVERYYTSKVNSVFVSDEDTSIRMILAQDRAKARKEKINRLNKENITPERLVNIDDAHKIHNISDATSIRQNSWLQRRIVLSMIRFAEEIYNEDPQLSCEFFGEAKKKINVSFRKKDEEKLGYIEEDGHIYDEHRHIIATKKGENHLVDEHGEIIGYLKGRVGYLYNDILIARDFELNRTDLENIYYREALNFPLMLDEMIKRSAYSYGEETELDRVVLPDIKNQKKSSLLARAMHTAGFNPYATFMENLTQLDDEFGKEYFVKEDVTDNI